VYDRKFIALIDNEIPSLWVINRERFDILFVFEEVPFF
jgi:hypothetical protein